MHVHSRSGPPYYHPLIDSTVLELPILLENQFIVYSVIFRLHLAVPSALPNSNIWLFSSSPVDLSLHWYTPGAIALCVEHQIATGLILAPHIWLGVFWGVSKGRLNNVKQIKRLKMLLKWLEWLVAVFEAHEVDMERTALIVRPLERGTFKFYHYPLGGVH